MAKDEENVYDEKGLEDLSDDEEISPGEEGFMAGYNAADGEEEKASTTDDSDVDDEKNL